MFITEYDEEKAFPEQKAEGRDGLLTVLQASEKVNMTVPEYEAAMQNI